MKLLIAKLFEIEANAKSSVHGKRFLSYGLIFLNFVILFAISLIPFGNIISIIFAGALSVGVCYFFLKILRSDVAEIEDLFIAFKSKEEFITSLVAYLLILAIILPTLLIFGGIWVFWVSLLLGDIENISSILGGANFEDAPYTMDPSFLSENSSQLFDSINAIILSALIIIIAPITIVSLLLSQVYFILADQKTNSGLEAIKTSINLMKSNIVKLFILPFFIFRVPILTFLVWLFLTKYSKVLFEYELVQTNSMLSYAILMGILVQVLYYLPIYYTSLAKFYQNLYD